MGSSPTSASPPAPGGHLRMETLAVTAGRGNGAPGDPLNVPLVAASVFHAGVERDYAREGTATWAAFEEVRGNLEGGQAVAFAAGMAAVDAAVAMPEAKATA